MEYQGLKSKITNKPTVSLRKGVRNGENSVDR